MIQWMILSIIYAVATRSGKLEFKNTVLIEFSVMNEWWFLYEDQTIPIEWYAISHDGEFYPEDWRYTD